MGWGVFVSLIAEADDRTGEAPVRRDRMALPALVSATAVSSLGNGLTALAIPWFVLITTGSAARTGLAAAVGAAAMIVAGVFGGTIVDRLGFKRASIVSDLASGITVALIPTLYFLDMLSFWLLLVLVFLGAVLDSPGSTARRSLIPSIIRRTGSTLERANSAMQFAQMSMGEMLAPLAAGVLIASIGAATVLYVNTTTFILSVLIVALFIPGVVRARNGQSEQVDEEPSSYFDELKEGFQYVATDPFLRKVIPVSIVANFLFSLVFLALPVMANQVYDSSRAFGLMAAGFGAGAGFGTILYGAFGHRIRRIVVYWGALLGASVGLWMLAFAPALWFAVLSTFLIGTFIGPVNAVGMVIMQASVPEHMFGRVFGFLNASGGVAAPAGFATGGLLVQAYGLTFSVGLAAAGLSITFIWVRLNRELTTLVDETERPAAPA